MRPPRDVAARAEALELRLEDVDPLAAAFYDRPLPRVAGGSAAEVLERVRESEAAHLRAIDDPRLRAFALALHEADGDRHVEDGGGELVRLAGDVAGPAGYELWLHGDVPAHQVASVARAIFAALRPRARRRFLAAWHTYWRRGRRLEPQSADRRAFELTTAAAAPPRRPTCRASRRHPRRRRALSRRASGSDPPGDDEPAAPPAGRGLALVGGAA